MLPYAHRRMVGPFIFFDHWVRWTCRAGSPRRSTCGRIRTSAWRRSPTCSTGRDHASRQHRVGAGDPPGRGELDDRGPGDHALGALREARREGGPMHAIQAWVALPRGGRDGARLRASRREDLPTSSARRRAVARLLAGEAFGREGAVTTRSPTVLCALGCWRRARAPGCRTTTPSGRPTSSPARSRCGGQAVARRGDGRVRRRASRRC